MTAVMSPINIWGLSLRWPQKVRCMTFKIMVYLALFSFTLNLVGEEIYREIEISSSFPTLLTFDSPPLAVACGPGGVLDFHAIGESGDYPGKQNQTNAALDSFLKVRALKKEGTVECSFPLTPKRTLFVLFHLKKKRMRPLISLKSDVPFEGDQGRLKTLLIQLIHGKPSGLREVSLENHSLSTKNAKLSLFYMGQNPRIKAFKLKYQAKKDHRIEQSINQKEMGDLYYSVYLKEKQNIKMIKKGEKIELLIMTRPDFSLKDLNNLFTI